MWPGYSHLLLGIIVLCSFPFTLGQIDIGYWINNVNTPSGSDDVQGPGSCLWEGPPEDGYRLTPCSTGICSDKAGSHKQNGTYRMTLCKKHYSLAAGSDLDSCFDGSWSSSGHQCIPCGRSTNNVDPREDMLLIHFGRNSSLGYFPWMAAIFMSLDEGRWEQTCGGTLISPRLVLSAAHCFTLAELDVQPQSIMVGLGKLQRSYYSSESSGLLSAVKTVVKPSRYVGLDHLFDLDIAVLVLAKTVALNDFIMPACVDWSGTMGPRHNEIGYLAGWGETEKGGASSTLKWAFQKYIDFNTCPSLIPPKDKKYLTHDKFCVEELKGRKADSGDSGGGLTFARDGVHYVYGIVSVKLTGEVKNLRLFTNLNDDGRRTWLQRVWRRVHFNRRQAPHVSAGCRGDSDCEDDKSCENRKCLSLCPQACGQNSLCKMTLHLPVCSCEAGYTGNPKQSCTKATARPSLTNPVVGNTTQKDPDKVQCKDGDNYYNVGETWSPPKTCISHYCAEGGYMLSKICPLQTVSEESTCYTTTPTNKWPDCCQHVICPNN